MAVTYGFFNSVDGDRTYNADQMSEYFEGLISDGVYESVGGALQVLAGSGMQVIVQTGRAVIGCKWIDVSAAETLQITAASAALNRWTAVVVRLNLSTRLMELGTVDGTPATTPLQPAMTNTSTVKEICLAMVYVAAGSTAITQANITDMRASSLCGWITGLVEQVDTSQLFLQWQNAYQAYYDEMTEQFNTWFAALTQQLNVNTYIEPYKKHTELSGSAGETVSLDMTGYTYDETDIINVYVNGLYAAEGVDYTMQISGTSAAVSPTATAAGTVIDVVVYRSAIGFRMIGTSGGSGIGTSQGSGITA